MAYDENLSRDLLRIGKQLERIADVMEWYKELTERENDKESEENEVKNDSTGGLEDD